MSLDTILGPASRFSPSTAAPRGCLSRICTSYGYHIDGDPWREQRYSGD